MSDRDDTGQGLRYGYESSDVLMRNGQYIALSGLAPTRLVGKGSTLRGWLAMPSVNVAVRFSTHLHTLSVNISTMLVGSASVASARSFPGHVIILAALGRPAGYK